MRNLILVALLLPLAACDKTPPTEPSPAQPPVENASGDAQQEPPAEDDGSNFASPPASEESPSEPAADPADPELAERIKKTFGEGCKFERECGEMIGVDCGAAADGPYYYAKKGSLEKVSTCGGACMGGRCTDCPPKGWSCETY